jgi:hypothetical protein
MAEETVSLDPHIVEGDKYYTVKQFAFLTNKSSSRIYLLIYKGNKRRKLEARYFLGVPMIPVKELEGFPFKREE